MRRVIIKAETPVMLNGFECPAGRGHVKRDFRRVHLQGKIDINGFKGFQDRPEATSEILKALLQVSLVGRREGVAGVPNTRPGKSVDHGRENEIAVGFGVHEFATRACGELEPFGRPLPNPFRFAVTPDFQGQNGLVTVVDVVADSLAHQMIGNPEGCQAVIGE
jgi:hypothetical protein